MSYDFGGHFEKKGPSDHYHLFQDWDFYRNPDLNTQIMGKLSNYGYL